MKRKSPKIVYTRALLLPLILITLSIIVLGQTNLQHSHAQVDAAPGVKDRLELGKVIRSELADGQSHSYMVTLEAGQYMRVVVSHARLAALRSIALRLSSIDGRKTFLHLSLQGPIARLEPICWIAKASGKYRLWLTMLGKTAATGVVSVELTELRAALPEDQQRIVAQGLLNHARAMIMRGNAPDAIGILERTLALSHDAKDREREATELSTIASGYVFMGQYEKAIGFSERALVIWREIKDRQDESNTLGTLGFAYSNLRKNETAIRYYEQSLAIKREINDPGEGVTLVLLGTAYSSVNEYEKAIAYLEEALPIARETGNQRGEASTLSNLGDALFNLSQYEKALAYYEQALAIERETGDRQGEAKALTSLGNMHLKLQQYERAIDYYKQSLERSDDRLLQSAILGNLGIAYFNLSRYGWAINYLEQAKTVASELKDHKGEGIALSGLGNTYSCLGQEEKAIGYYEQSLAIARETKDRMQEGIGLSNLGSASFVLGQYVTSVNYHLESLAIAREIKDRELEGTDLDELGNSYYGLGQMDLDPTYYDKAVSYHEQSLAIWREINNHKGQVFALTNLGTIYRLIGAYEKAVGYYEQALAVEREVEDRRVETFIFTGMMKAQRASGKPRLAIFYGKRAVNNVQSIRADIRDLTPELRKSFLKGNEQPYHTLAELLIAQGRLTEAEQVLNLLKEQEYFEFVRRDSKESTSLTQQADLTPDEAEWENRYREIGDQLVALGTARGELLAKKTLTPEETKHLAQLEQDLAVGNAAFDKFLGELAKHFSTMSEATTKVEQMRETQGIMEDLRELPQGTVAIYTLVGEDKYRTILVTPDVQRAYEYPIKDADLNRKVLEFRQVLQNPKLDPRPLGQELYKILVANLADDLRQAKARTLMWSLDGTLRYLPLAALYDGKNYLIEQYALTVFTPASNARLKDRPDAVWKAAGFGVTKAHEGAPALPSVASELSGIIEGKEGQGGILVGEIKLDDQFTEDAMRQTLLKHYPVVHIASHFRFQPGNETNSFLLLGDGNHLSLAELKTLPNLFGGVQLLTLSACNTGVGDSNADGKEVEGLGVLAQRKGAKAVVASLWSVADVSTSLLMQEFYRARESSATTKAEALRQAQLALLRGTPRTTETTVVNRALMHEPVVKEEQSEFPRFPLDPKTPYAHPYYWAPFFLMGNWL